MNKYIKWFMINSYLLCLFLVLMPSIKIEGYYTHGIAKLIIIVQFLFFLLKRERISIKYQKNIFIFIILFYVASQSVGIINSINIGNFIYRYKNFIFELLFFVNTLHILPLLSNKTPVLKIILFTVVINIAFQLLIKANIELFINHFGYFFDSGTIEVVQMNSDRGRVYFENYNEAFVPLFYYLIQESLVKTRLPTFFIVFLTYITSFFSLFRTRLLMLFSGFLYLIKTRSKKAYVGFFIITFFFLLLGTFTRSNENINIVDRLEINQENLETIDSRIKQAKGTSLLGSTFLLFGVGQGNYLDYFGKKDKSITNYYKGASYSVQVPHNVLLEVFFESGIVGLISYLILLSYFLIQDIPAFFKKEQNSEKRAYVVAFWTLFIYAFFNPTRDLFSFNCIFWFFRSNLISTRK